MNYIVKITAGEAKGMYLDSCGEVCDRRDAFECGSDLEAEDLIAMSMVIDDADKPKIIRIRA